MILNLLYYINSNIGLFAVADINECDQKSTCDGNAVCKNMQGSYTCKCKEGFSGDGKTCIGNDISINLTNFINSIDLNRIYIQNSCNYLVLYTNLNANHSNNILLILLLQT